MSFSERLEELQEEIQGEIDTAENEDELNFWQNLDVLIDNQLSSLEDDDEDDDE